MNPLDTSHCRLCAEIKQIEKLINLECDESKHLEVVNKLSRLNTSTPIMLEKDVLPKTVCLVCVSSLDKAFEFVEKVEHAQQILKDTYIAVKKENSISDDNIELPASLTPEQTLVKEELVYEEEPFYEEEPINEEPVNEELVYEEPVNEEPVYEEEPVNEEPINKEEPVNEVKPFNGEEPYNEEPVNEELFNGEKPLNEKEPVIEEEPFHGDKLVCDNAVKPPKTTKKQEQKPQLSWKDYKWTCAHCYYEFLSIDELKEHLLTYHQCCNAFKCTDCTKSSLRLDKFIYHMKRHRKHLKLSCYVCNSIFPSSNKLRLHEKVHLHSEHVCPGCSTQFKNFEDLNQHSKLYYKNRLGQTLMVTDATEGLTCVLCKKTFKNKDGLNGHLLIHSEKCLREKVHVCDRCGKGYYSKYNLAAHVASHEDLRPFKCEICKSDFKTSIRLKAHSKVHEDSKPHSCDRCGKSFRLKKQLKSHEIIHTDSMPFVCPHCSKTFRFKNILELHLRQHTGVQPYCCELCQRNFTNWSNYNKHMKRRHGTSVSKRKPNIVVKNVSDSDMLCC